MEGRPRNPRARPVAHPSLSKDVVVGRQDGNGGRPAEDRRAELLVNRDAPTVKVLLVVTERWP